MTSPNTPSKGDSISHEVGLQSIIDNISDLIWAVSDHLKLIASNEVFDKAVIKLIGKKLNAGESVLHESISKELQQTWKNNYEKALEGLSFRTESVFQTDKLMQRSETTFVPIKDKAGNINGVSCVSRNITQHHEQLLKLEQQNEALRQIAWIQSHKVRSQVSTILGLSQFINKSIIDDPELNTIMDGIKAAAIELDAVIKEINELTRDADLEV